MPISAEALKASEAPPVDAPPVVQALWQTAHGDWDAHVIVQDDKSTDAAGVHAQLHRVEGDLQNAAYWCNRAGKPVCDASLDAEWAALVEALACTRTVRNKFNAMRPNP